MREVAVIGAGMTRFGELWDSSLRQLFADAALEALKSAGADRVDSVYVGNMSAGRFVDQEHLAHIGRPLLVSLRRHQSIFIATACSPLPDSL